ncbi:hypothetical protein YC2023_002747 [Brassica napus]
MTGTQLLDELAQAVRSLVQLYQLNYVQLDHRKGYVGSLQQVPQTSIPGIRHLIFESLRLGRSSQSIASGLLGF